MIVSWNVDGYTKDIHEWLKLLITVSHPDVIFLSETKKSITELTSMLNELTDYHIIINAHIPCNWHGVVMLINKKHQYEQIVVKMGIPTRKDTKCDEAATGRVIVVKINDTSGDRQGLYIVGSYTPNSGRSELNKLDYRVKVWDPAFQQLLEQYRRLGPTVWMGDINVALDPIDVSNPKSMARYAGFTPQERANFKHLLDSGEWIDIWRQQNPADKLYTWRGYNNKKDYGMRLDNIVISKSLLNRVKNAFVVGNSPQTSDHVPIGLYVTL